MTNFIQNKTVEIIQLGLISYKDAWEYQEKLLHSIVEIKNKNRDNNENTITPNYIILCEHHPVFTIGKSGKINHLLVDKSELESQKVDFFETNRGGDITFHGPGQIVVYPIIDLENFFTDIHKYLRFLEQVVINTLLEYGIVAGRVDGLTGVWVDIESNNPRKICAMGVRTSRWVAMHGFALNVTTDLQYFSKIVACGIADKAVTSIECEINKKITLEEISQKVIKNMIDTFEMKVN